MSREITKEEEAVLAAALEWFERGNASVDEPLEKAVHRLTLSRAPKKPMSAEERARRLMEGGWWWAAGDTPQAFRARILEDLLAAESATWDRCMEAVLKILLSSCGKEAYDRLVALKGRYHEATP